MAGHTVSQHYLKEYLFLVSPSLAPPCQAPPCQASTSATACMTGGRWGAPDAADTRVLRAELASSHFRVTMETKTEQQERDVLSEGDSRPEIMDVTWGCYMECVCGGCNM